MQNMAFNKKGFIKMNREFWSDFPAKENGKKILIEEPSIPVITHGNAVFSLILNQARSLTPVWLCSNKKKIELLKSYVPTSEFILISKPVSIDTVKIIFISVLKFLNLLKTKDILSFSYKGVKYGDIVYNTYLLRKKVGTVRKINISLLKIIFTCIRRHELIRKILKKDNFEGVLVGHQVGIHSGVMLRTALHYGYIGYLREGNHEPALRSFSKVDDVYDSKFKPSPKDVELILSKLGDDLDAFYNKVLEKQISGLGSRDARYAFSQENKLYTDRESFNRDFGLDPKNKNIFIMLHALNDHPHSSRWLIFKDYYDWFIQTLEFAKKNPQVNWIFKQHPSIGLFVVKDVSFEAIFSNVPKNIIYINENKQIDTRSLVSCADLIVTCIGSAGFQLPAMGGIPSITAGDNFYTGLGFAKEPKTREEYFDHLRQAQNIQRLSPDQQKRARAAFIYIHELSGISMSVCPMLTEAQEKNRELDKSYLGMVMERLGSQEKIIKLQIRNCIEKVSSPTFKRLNELETFVLRKEQNDPN